MKKFIFSLYNEKEPQRIEIYSINYMEAKKNVTAATGCKEDSMLFIKEPDTFAPQQWIF